jgi:hypothetical protein
MSARESRSRSYGETVAQLAHSANAKHKPTHFMSHLLSNLLRALL